MIVRKNHWLGLAFFIATRIWLLAFAPQELGDVTLYRSYSARVFEERQVPYETFAVEYPPPCLWLMYAAGCNFTPGAHWPDEAVYGQRFRILMLLFDVGSAAVVAPGFLRPFPPRVPRRRLGFVGSVVAAAPSPARASIT